MEKLGIDPLLILTQTINFLILMFVLQRFLYKPVLQALEKRRSQVVEIETEKAELAKLREEISHMKEEVLAESRKEAEGIITNARAQSEGIKLKIEGDAHKKAQEIIERGEASLMHKAHELESQLAQQVAQVAVKVSEQVLRESLSNEQRSALLDQSLKSFKNVQ
jgi:F-type H+-transporting ATPase subunit b